MHLNWVLVASKMQSLRHGFAKRTTGLSFLNCHGFKLGIGSEQDARTTSHGFKLGIGSEQDAKPAAWLR